MHTLYLGIRNKVYKSRFAMYLWSQNCILIYTLAHKFPTLKGKDNETKIKLFYFKM